MPGLWPSVFGGRTAGFSFCAPKRRVGETTKFLDESFTRTERRDRFSAAALGSSAKHDAAEISRIQPEDVVLDLGCGSGRFCVWSLDAGAHVIGIDTGSFFAREAQANVDLVVGELRKLPFGDGS